MASDVPPRPGRILLVGLVSCGQGIAGLVGALLITMLRPGRGSPVWFFVWLAAAYTGLALLCAAFTLLCHYSSARPAAAVVRRAVEGVLGAVALLAQQAILFVGVCLLLSLLPIVPFEPWPAGSWAAELECLLFLKVGLVVIPLVCALLPLSEWFGKVGESCLIGGLCWGGLLGVHWHLRSGFVLGGAVLAGIAVGGGVGGVVALGGWQLRKERQPGDASWAFSLA